jgi:WhiB family transcriptional regulator, redox-sensing transcriptional regulator
VTSRPEILELLYQGRLDQVVVNLPDLFWALEGNCVGLDPEVFFPRSREQVGVAKEICDTCPVSDACLQAALQGRESGIWGGTTESERFEAFGIRPRETLIQQAEASAVLKEVLTADANYLSQKYQVECRTVFRWKQRVQSEQIALSFATVG